MSATPVQLVALTISEIDVLHGSGPLAFQTYVLLRAWMDYPIGVVGRTRPVSLSMLRSYTETHTPRGAGLQIEQESEKTIRGAIDRLVRAGLLRRLAGDRLSFRLPMALTASARPIQTGHGEGTDLPTEHGAVNSAKDMGNQAKPGTRSTPEKSTNGAHIMSHGMLLSTGDLVDILERHEVPIAGCSAALVQWAAAGVQPARLADAITAARAVRQKSGSLQPINAGLIDTILKNGAAPPAQFRARKGRWSAAERPEANHARPGESWEQYRRRLAGTAPH